MRVNARISPRDTIRPDRRGEAAFTLAEVLAALLFMAIVIPVAVEGLRVASRAGELASRKAVAIRIADLVLNQRVLSDPQAGTAGVVDDGPIQYRWDLREEAWSEAELQLVTAEVRFPVQNDEFSVHLSTLLDTSGVSASTNSETSLP